MSRKGENIRMRKDGRWEGRYIIGKNVYGKSVYHSIYGKTYGEVKEKMKKNTDIQCLDSSSMNNTSFDDIAMKWLQEVEKRNKYSTYIKYKNIYNKHLRIPFSGMDIYSITTDEYVKKINNILSYRNKNNSFLSQNTICSIKNVIFQILSYGGYSSIIPAIRQQLIIPKDKMTVKPINVFSREEQSKLLDYLMIDLDLYKLGILVCLYTGLRLGELCALETSSISLDKRIIQVKSTVQRIESSDTEKKTKLFLSLPKTASSYREIPLCDFLVELLKKNMPNTKYLINGNSPMEPRTYQYKFDHYLKLLNIENLHFHSIRHTFATNCIESGMDIKCLSEILGHADVKTTMNRYVHPSFETKMKQINIFAANYGQIDGQINGQKKKKSVKSK